MKLKKSDKLNPTQLHLGKRILDFIEGNVFEPLKFFLVINLHQYTMIQFSQRMKLSSLSVSSWLISWFTPPLLTNEKCKFTVWFTLKQCYFLLHFWSMTIYIIPKCSILQILQSQQIVSYTTDSRRGGFGWVTSKTKFQF